VEETRAHVRYLCFPSYVLRKAGTRERKRDFAEQQVATDYRNCISGIIDSSRCNLNKFEYRTYCEDLNLAAESGNPSARSNIPLVNEFSSAMYLNL
jgi:hypothetical protein